MIRMEKLLESRLVLPIKLLFHKFHYMTISGSTHFKFLCLMDILKLSRYEYKFRKYPIYGKLAFSVGHDFFLGIIFFEEDSKFRI